MINNSGLKARDFKNMRIVQEAEKAKATKQDLAEGSDEDWDAELPCPPSSTPLGAKLAQWLKMMKSGWPWPSKIPIDDSVSGDCGVGTVKTAVKIEPDRNEEELCKAAGGTFSNVFTGDVSD